MSCELKVGQREGGGGGRGCEEGADVEASHFTLALLAAPLFISSQPSLLLLLGLQL